MLDERRSAILSAVVEEHIETAQPVGSGSVARHPDVDVSSATVRHDMVLLENEGFLSQPHTSAGRVPTDKGYRFFVDTLARPDDLGRSQRDQVGAFFTRAHGALEEMLHDTSTLLAALTDYAAVVVGPNHEAASVRSVQLVGLGERTALAVAVLSDGTVRKATLELARVAAADALSLASRHLMASLTGATLDTLGVPPPTADPAVDELCRAAVAGLAGQHDHDLDQVFVGGASRMVASFDAIDTVRQVLATLEQQFVVVGLLRDVLDRGQSVAIGAEHGLQPLSECSVVVAPYGIGDETLGTIGVLGPTRMHYAQALAAVATVSHRLGRRLAEG